jgi:hypothetical protein
MSRRPNLEPSARINLAIPMSKKAWLDMYLFDVSQRRVPVGAYQKVFLEKIDELQTQAKAYER